MAEKKHPNLVDITVKEGGFKIHHAFLPQQVADLTREIQRSRVPYAEVSHGCGIGGFRRGYPGLHHDKDLLKAAHEAAPNLNYMVYLAAYPYSVIEIEPLSELFSIGRVGVNVDAVEEGAEQIKKLKGLKKTCIVQLLRVHARDARHAIDAARQAEDLGADIVYLTDSFGSMSAGEVAEYTQAVKNKVTLPLGFQGRNNTLRAMENTLTAFHSGAEWLDASLMGFGRGAGVASLEVLVSLLQREGYCLNIDLAELTHATSFGALPLFRIPPAVEHLDLLFAKHRIDYYPQEIIGTLAHILEISPENFLLNLKKKYPDLIQLRLANLGGYLADEGLDMDVVMEYLQTGKITTASDETAIT